MEYSPTIMIDLNRIRSIKILKGMRQDLTDFLNNDCILDIYLNDYSWSQNDYEADKEDVSILLEKVDRRINSLIGMEARNAAREKKVPLIVEPILKAEN